MTCLEGPEDPIHTDDRWLKKELLHPDVDTLLDGSELWLVYKLRYERTINQIPTVEKNVRHSPPPRQTEFTVSVFSGNFFSPNDVFYGKLR